MKFEVVDVEDCAVYQGDTYTYTAVVEIDQGRFEIGENYEITPDDEGDILEMELYGTGRILERVEKPEGIVGSGDSNIFEGTIEELRENSFLADVDGQRFKVESNSLQEEWPDLEEGDAVKFKASFYPASDEIA